MRQKVAFTAITFRTGILLLCMLTGSLFIFAQTQSTSEPGVLQYGPAKEVCKVKDSRMNEMSGIAASIVNKDAFWTHNDSGDSARIFLFNKDCETIAVVTIKNVKAIDWEDIASFKKGKDGYLLIADTGDNFRVRKTGVLYIIREPLISVKPDTKEAAVVEVEPESIIDFSYEDGLHDCESAAVDPTESTIYLVSKEPKQNKVYSMPIPTEGSKQPNVAKAIATLKLPYATAMDTYTTAMDISPDGMRAVILTYGDAYEFSRSKGDSWAKAFSRDPRTIKAPRRPQGEAVCYGADGKTLYFASEGGSQPLWEMPAVEN